MQHQRHQQPNVQHRAGLHIPQKETGRVNSQFQVGNISMPPTPRGWRRGGAAALELSCTQPSVWRGSSLRAPRWKHTERRRSDVKDWRHAHDAGGVAPMRKGASARSPDHEVDGERGRTHWCIAAPVERRAQHHLHAQPSHTEHKCWSGGRCVWG